MTDTSDTDPNGAPWRNFYGRRFGKTLRGRQADLLADFLPTISPKGVEWDENPDRTPIDMVDLFGDDRPVWLEVGFGAGEHMVAQAQANPDVGIIGCEPYINGVAACLSKVEREQLTNIRVLAGDARDMLDVIPEGTLDRAFLLYPDPWPKSRHHRRRFVIEENLRPLARAMKPGTRFHVATDIEDYVRQTLEVIHKMPEFEWTAESPADWRTPWDDWHRTRYEAKAIREDRTPHYMTFIRT